ncbi:MAG: hypothetical protein JWQ97_3234 [Phenylobacterium sp.]|nr:hypothetical protein [Phenylobacterium sp.]
MDFCLAYLVLLFATVILQVSRKGLLAQRRAGAALIARPPARYDRVGPAGEPLESLDAAATTAPPELSAAWRVPGARDWIWGTAARMPAYGPSLLTLGFVLVDLSRLAVEPPLVGEPAWTPAEAAPALAFGDLADAGPLPLWDAVSPPHGLSAMIDRAVEEPAPSAAWPDAFRPEAFAHGPEHGWFV